MCSLKNPSQHKPLVTGIGITSAIGQGKDSFFSSLKEGKNAFGVLKRAGRRKDKDFLGAEISSLIYPTDISKRVLRTASYSGHVAMVTLDEAWKDAELDNVDPLRIGLIIGGSNFQQREMVEMYSKYADQPEYIKPTYALSFMDSDLSGLCTEHFGIKGFGYTIGGASASGQAAVIQAAQAVEDGHVDVCIAVGALMDISYLECQAFRSLGAMGSDRFINEPDKACRPFDEKHDGFIYGESCGVVVVESEMSAKKRKSKAYGTISGWSIGMDANRNPNPSYDGEVMAIENALQSSGLTASDIDYVNPHGTASIVGDETELKALKDCNLSHAYINATKSITGHGLSAAGTVEIIASLLQMKESVLHPTRNLENPIDKSFNWIKDKALDKSINNILNLSMGFGGINTAVCLQKYNK